MRALAYGLLLAGHALGWADRGQPVVSGYYPAYNSHLQPPSKIPWSHYTHIDYFVAPVQDDPDKPFKIEDEKNLLETVALAKAHNVSISLCIGGWTGSKFFSVLVKTNRSRDKFATSLVRTIKKYNLDGVDLDWEYPGVAGEKGNIVSPADTANFLKFLRILRKKLGGDYRISAAVSVKGLMGADGKYLKDTKAFSEVLDYITIMAYDIYVSGSGGKLSGPNAPLFDECSDPESKYSVSGGIETWTQSGFPARKMLLGLPAYGYAYTLLSSELRPTRFSGPQGKTSLLFQNVSAETPQGGSRSGSSGHWLYHELYLDQKLAKDGTRGTAGYKRHFDHCTQTPFLFHQESKNLIVYDDRQSIYEKTRYAKTNSLAGINFFDTTGDTPDRKLVQTCHLLFPPTKHPRKNPHTHNI